MSDPASNDNKNLSPTILGQIELICDRFESAWRGEAKPRIEDYWREADGPDLLRELLVLELTYRIKGHDHPEPADYQQRFAAHAEVIRAAFEAVPARHRSPGPLAPSSSRSSAERNLLFGVLAMQMDFVTREALIAAVSTWVLDKSKPLDRILVEQGALAADERDLLEPLIHKHLTRHGGDAGRSLASVGSRGAAREALQHVADPELDASLALLGALDPTDVTTDNPQSIRLVPENSGVRRFHVLRPLARGGLGEVFVARDQELQREVALKLIQGRHASDPGSRTRFQFEAEITGRLEHPGVIPVYGLGVDERGRAYYAMRFVRGESLKESIERFHREDGPTREAGERSLAFRELLGRFVDVCNTMAYAHGRGILHRDLKPANVMLGPYGETLVVDWGLAKVAGRPDGEPSPADASLELLRAGAGASTEPGSWLGTPAYMSPEQAAGRIDQIGPASDVYSLGATLYNLLTGKTAFDGTDVLALLGKIRTGDFPPPRSVDPTIDPALESVCLKAMALTPGDRFASCRALADDLERWAADEPVSCWREPLGRRARRWAQRNRTAVTAAAAALVASVVGLSALAAEQARSNAALTDANGKTRKALEETRQARDDTKAALTQSEESRQQAEAVGNFLVDALKKPDPAVEGKDVKVADVLDQAATGLDKGFSGSKATEGALRDALGRSFLGLGLYPKAEEAFRKARALREATLGPEHPDTLMSRARLANAYWREGRTAEAIAMDEVTLRLRESRLGPDHPHTLDSRSNLASDYREAGRTAEAIAMDEATLRLRESKLGPDHPDTLASRNNLAIEYAAAGHIAEAIPMFEATLRLRESKLGPDHPDTLASRTNLATAYWAAGRIAEAIAIHEVTLRLCQSKLGPDHPLTLNSRNNLAIGYQAAGRTTEAIAMYEGTLRLQESKLGLDHPHTLASRTNLAIGYQAEGRTAEAIAMHEATLRLKESKLGPDHPRTLDSRNFLADAYGSAGRWTDAEALYRDTLARRRKKEKPDNLLLAGDLAALGRSLLKQSKWSDAEPLLHECLAIREKSMPDDWIRYDAMSLLGGALLGQGSYAEAEPRLVAGYEGMKTHEARIPAHQRFRLREAAERVVHLYEAWDKTDQAATWKAKLGMADMPADVFARP
jgi:eukaryotic-like serine/threonine-protein kinase